ncbi:pyridoxine 5'-phosphate synthase [Desulfocurvibacter africanus]|uniref:Pyridoxine 5'-phosphate synthase n=1 Tax=Desulfocurvibacter africanus subsp. africanus str. Walvis Bay TaxID=690850 RepID=F3Z0W1_DESAF|nr:pyridoxine 5'-phosphate synthase [Desulfocurvibacter africanus]EGJ51039.1 Pyridoxine 5'-phosphate synthase [Desulfocurvibacter africanus subsp. africanus str. Walvis Bay]
MPVLAVNIDHVATLRQARKGIEPEPVTAAALAELAGAQGIIVHLREDRRHIQDRDVQLLRQTVQTKFNLEMAATREMQGIALATRPDTVCLVPEKREELTTEGGLNLLGREKELAKYIAPLRDAGILISLFIDADQAQIDAAGAIAPEFIEIHTGHYADAKGRKRALELERIISGIVRAQGLGIKVNLGHGLNYNNVQAFRSVSGISEYSIGHSIMSRAVLVGLERAVREMAAIVEGFAE